MLIGSPPSYLRFVILSGFRQEAIRSLEKQRIDYFIYFEDAPKKLDILRYKHCKGMGKVLPRKEDLKEKKIYLIPVTEKGVYWAQKIFCLLPFENRRHLDFYSLVFDKLLMKEKLAICEIPITPFMRGNQKLDIKKIQQDWGPQIVIKDRVGSGSRNLIISKQSEILQNALSENKIVEKLISYEEESSVESFICNKKIFFTNITRYLKYGKCNLVPANFSSERNKIILDLNQKVLEALEIENGMTHLEFFLTSENKIIFGEVAWRPPGGHIMKLLSESYGIDSWEVFLKTFFESEMKINNAAQTSSLSYLLHPGPGKVKKMRGWELVENSSFLVKQKLKIKIGDVVSNRLGLGEDVGHFILKGEETVIIKELEKIEKELVIELWPVL